MLFLILDGVYGFGNTHQESPLVKVLEGRRVFGSIIENNGLVHKETELQQSLLQFMGSNKK